MSERNVVSMRQQELSQSQMSASVLHRPSILFTFADKHEKIAIAAHMREIDPLDALSIAQFASHPQSQLCEFTHSIRRYTEHLDIGTSENLLGQLVRILHSFDVRDLHFTQRRSILLEGIYKSLGILSADMKFMRRYLNARLQIEPLAATIQKFLSTSLHNLNRMEKLHQLISKQLNSLRLYITAGEEQLRIIDTKLVPALEVSLIIHDNHTSNLQLETLRINRCLLEKRLHNLKLTRQSVTIGARSLDTFHNQQKEVLQWARVTLGHAITAWQARLASIATHLTEPTQAQHRLHLKKRVLARTIDSRCKAKHPLAQRFEKRTTIDQHTIQRINQQLMKTVNKVLAKLRTGIEARSNTMVSLIKMKSGLQPLLASASQPMHSLSAG